VAMGMKPNPLKKTLSNLYVTTIKDYISLLDDNEKNRLRRNLRVDFESGQKPKKDKPSTPSKKPKKAAQSKKITKPKRIKQRKQPKGLMDCGEMI